MLDKEQRIREGVFGFFPDNASGKTFSELVAAAAKLGIQKPTLWRHLKRLVKLDLVIHEGRLYRRNLLSDVDGPGLTVAIGPRGFTVSREAKILSVMRSHQFDHWDPKVPSVLSEANLGDPGTLLKMFLLMMIALKGQYLLTLTHVAKAPNLATAREIANIEVGSDIHGLLMGFARSIWDQRARAGPALRELAKDTDTVLGPYPEGWETVLRALEDRPATESS